MPTLSPKQQAFVEAYARGATGTDAALAAGYSKKRPDVSASKLLAQKHIAEALADLRAKASKLAVVDVAWIQEELISTYKAARETLDLPSANTSLKMLGLQLGMFQPKKDGGGDGEGGGVHVTVMQF